MERLIEASEKWDSIPCYPGNIPRTVTILSALHLHANGMDLIPVIGNQLSFSKWQWNTKEWNSSLLNSSQWSEW